MAPVEAALQELLRNDTERSTLALSTVQKIVNNILSHQDDPKYRRLRTENKAIKEKVLSAVGGGALLEALGFAAQGGDELVLPMEASPVTLLQARMKIDAALTRLTSPPPPPPPPPAPAAAPAAAPVASAPPAAASPAEDAMEVDAPADEVRPAEDEAMADGDDDLAAALALSATNNGLRHPPPTPATAPAAAPAGAPGGAQEALAQRVRPTHPNAHPRPRPRPYHNPNSNPNPNPNPSPNLNPDPDPNPDPRCAESFKSSQPLASSPTPRLHRHSIGRSRLGLGLG